MSGEAMAQPEGGYLLLHYCVMNEQNVAGGWCVGGAVLQNSAVATFVHFLIRSVSLNSIAE
jgi:hypothetical protein